MQEFFCAAVKVQIVFRTREAMSFIRVHNKRDLAAILADGVHDLFRLRKLHPGINLSVANQQRHVEYLQRDKAERVFH